MLKKLIPVVCLIINGCVTKNTESIDQAVIIENKNAAQLLKSANFYYSNDDFKRAVIFYDAYIKKDTIVDAETYYKRGYCNAQLLNLTASTNDYLKAAEMGYREADAYYNAGVNATLDVKDSLAIYFFKESLKYNPTDTAARNEIEKAKQRLEELEKLDLKIDE